MGNSSNITETSTERKNPKTRVLRLKLEYNLTVYDNDKTHEVLPAYTIINFPSMEIHKAYIKISLRDHVITSEIRCLWSHQRSY